MRLTITHGFKIVQTQANRGERDKKMAQKPEEESTMTNLNSAAVPASVSLSLSSKASEAEGLEKFLLGMFANVAKEVEARAETDQVVVLRQEAEKAPVVEAPSAEDIAKAEAMGATMGAK